MESSEESTEISSSLAFTSSRARAKEVFNSSCVVVRSLVTASSFSLLSLTSSLAELSLVDNSAFTARIFLHFCISSFMC